MINDLALPKVSVIIPVYNGEKFVGRAIESVLAQTVPAFEIIVINDGSKDGTEKVLDFFKDKIIFKTVPNGGVASARNFGVNLARGEYIALLDSDDVWVPHKLEIQMSALAQFSEAEFCCSDFILQTPVRTYSHFESLKNYPVSKADHFVEPQPFEALVKRNFVGTSTAVFSRKLIDKAGLFNTHYKVSEDYDFWLRCAMNTKFVVVAQPLVQKQQHETNLSNNKIRINFSGQRVLRNIYEQNAAFIKEHDLGDLCRAKIAGKYYRIGDLYFENGRIRRAYKLYFCGLVYGKARGNNMIEFLFCVLKKTMRLLTFGLLSRATFGMKE